MMKGISSGSGVCVALLLCTLPLWAAQAPTFELTFLATDGSADGLMALEKDPRVVRVFGDGPCGATVTVRMSDMPSAVETAFRADIAIELSVEGATLREWAVPYEKGPIAAKGDEILIDNYGDLIWIKTDGSIRAELSKEFKPGKIGAACPDPVNTLQNQYCVLYRDLDDGRARYFATGDICT